MKKKRKVVQLALLLVVALLLLGSAGISLARPSRSHTGLYTYADRVFPNGMIFGYIKSLGLPEEVYDSDFPRETAQAFVSREKGDQELMLDESLEKGPEESEFRSDLVDNHIAPFWIIKWYDPIYPSRVIGPNTNMLFSEHQQDGGGSGDNDSIYKACSEYNEGPPFMVGSDCRLSEDAVGPSWFKYCENRPQPGEDAKNSIYIPADVDIFDLNVDIDTANMSGKVPVSLEHETYPPVELTADLSPTATFFDDSFDDQGLQPKQPLSKLNGRSAKGSWTLNVNLENVELRSWCLDLLAYRTARFSQPTYTVQEDAGTVNVMIELSEPSMTKETVVTVNTVPKPGSGQQAWKSKAITIAAKNKSASVSIPIIDNGNADGDEEVAVEISVEKGKYGLTSQSFAAIKIIDDEGGGQKPVGGDGIAFIPVVSGGQGILYLAGSDPAAAQAKTWQALAGSAAVDGISAMSTDAQFADITSDTYGQPYIVWSGKSKSSGEYEIFVLKWDGQNKKWIELRDQGTGNGPTDKISGDAKRASITMNRGNFPVIAWEQLVNGTWQIYAKRWNGSEWKEIGKSATNGGISKAPSGGKANFPSIIVSKTGFRGIHIVAYRYQAPGAEGEIYVKYYDKESDSWLGIAGSAGGGGISQTTGNSTNPSIAENQPFGQLFYNTNPSLGIFVAWNEEDQSTGNFDVYLKGGSVFQEPSGKTTGGVWSSVDGGGPNISDSPANSPYARVAAERNNVHVTWSEDRNGKGEIYYKKYVPSFGGWKQDEKASRAAGGGLSNNEAGDSRRPTISIGKQGFPYIVWEDDVSGQWQIFGKAWDGESWEALGPSTSGGGISNIAGTSERPVVSLGTNGVPYVVWMQGASGEQDIYLKWYQWWD